MRQGKKCLIDNGKTTNKGMYYDTLKEAVARMRNLPKNYRSRCFIGSLYL